jgi:hypothetical protein
MRTYLAAALAATLAISVPAVGFAAQAKNAKATATHKAAPEKSAKGTVTSINDTMLVLKTKHGDMHFKVDAMTKHDGIASGANAMVHYKTEGKDMVATSVTPDAAPAKTTKK